MTEILTESFCERCGTRYTFESARPRVRLKGVKVLSRGLKNFVMSDDSSIDEAMAAARSDTDRELTAHQLDAFHKTFNFCMSCRQYTCPNCWNDAEARCLSCAPSLGQAVMPAPFPDLVPSSYLVADPVDTAVTNGSNGHDAVAEDAPFWGTDLAGDAPVSGVDVADDAPASGVDVANFAARLAALTSPPAESPAKSVAEPVVAAKVVDEVIEDGPAETPVDEVASADVEPVAADIAPVAAQENADIAPVAPQETAASDESDEAAQIAARLAAWGAAAAALDAKDDESGAGTKPAQTGGLLRRFRAGQNLDAELDAYEQEQTTPVAGDSDAETVAAEAVVAAAAIAADQAKVEPEATAIEYAVEVEVEPAAIEPEVEPEAEAIEYAVEVEPAPAATEPEVEAQAIEYAVEVEPEAVAAVEVEVAAEPEAPASFEPEAAVAVEPEPEPEPVAAERDAEPDPTPAPEPVDVIQQPTWRMVAPDPTIERPATPPISPAIPAAATAPDPNAEPQWPARASAEPSVGLPFLNRPAAATGGLEALWAESARDVVAPPTIGGRPVATGGVQPCVSCGLSLSATARFCRRCGTPQAV